MQLNQSPRRKFKIKRIALLAAVLAVALGGLYGLHQYQVRRQAGVLLDRAAEAADRKDWAAASGLYQAYLNFRPEDADAIVKYAETLEQWTETNPGAVYDLIRIYERLLVVDPNRSEQRRKLAGHYITVASYPAARNHLNTLISASAGGSVDPELYVMLATCAERERKFAEATGFLRQALSAGKTNPAVHLRLAFLLRRTGTPEAERDADEVMNALVVAQPNDLDALLARAEYRMMAGDVKGAREDLERAHRLPAGAEHPEVVLALARLAATPEETDSARAALTKAAAAHPTDARIQVALADLQARGKNTAEAQEILRKAAEHATRADGTLLEIADRLLDLGDQKTPAELVKRFAEDPKLAYLGDYLTGRLQLMEGNWPAALPALQRAIAAPGFKRLAPQYVKAQLALAECHKQANNPDARLRALDAALAVDARSIEAQLARADALIRAGQFQPGINAYQSLVQQNVASARVELAKLRLSEQASRSERDRDWSAFQEVLGPEPLPADLAALKANALLIQNKPDDAIAYLEKRLLDSGDKPALWLALAMARALSSPEAGLEVLDRAEKKLGPDRVELRLARAELLGRAPSPNVAAISRLGSNVAALSRKDRYVLLGGLAEVLVRLGHRAEAVEFFRRASAEQPFDLLSRIYLFDLALALKDEPLQTQVLRELEGIEGPEGPTRLLLEATAAALATKPGETAQTATIRARLEPVRQKRENWGRLYILLGDLDILDGNRDAAVDNYRRALRLGERGEALVSSIISLLMERQAHLEALEILSTLSRSGPLTPGLARQHNLLRAMFGEEAERGLTWAKAASGSRDPRDHLARAAVFAANNAPDEARRALEQAVARAEDKVPEVWVALVRFLAGQGKTRDAVAAVEQATARLTPATDTPEDRAAVQLALGVCREVIEDFPKAEAHYRKALALTPRDPGANRQLSLLLQRTGRRAEGEALLDNLTRADAPPAVRRWARRTLAFSKINQPDGYAELPAALALIEENLKEGNLLDDQRAKALILAIDPLKRAEAIAMLADSARIVPLPADQNFLLGRLYLLQNQPEKAEVVLRLATRAAAPPEYFALLVRAQLATDNPGAARLTVARMKEVAPRAWITLAEEARVLAATGQKTQAGQLVVEAVGADDAAALASRAGPLLEEIGCLDDAEKVYKDLAARGTTPTAHAPLASFYIRVGRAADALRVAWTGLKKNAPAGLTARLLSAAARSRPLALIPEADRSAWEAELAPAEGWVAEQLKGDPKNPELLFAMAEFDDLRGRYDDEIRRYEQVLALAPDNEAVLNNLALLLALHREDGSERTLGYVTRAMAKRGPKPGYLDTRAVVHIAGKRFDQAIQDLNAAMSLDPKPVYYYHLAVAHEKQRAEKPDARMARDAALKEAVQRGLTKAMLHPKEWNLYDELIGPNGSK